KGPVQLLMDGDGSPVPQEVPLLQAFADGLRESVIFFPGWGNGDTAIEFFAAGGGIEIGLGGLLDIATTPFVDPSQGVELFDASAGVATRHGADGGVILLDLLPADIPQLGPAEVGVLF